jgi:hypothetical protein
MALRNLLVRIGADLSGLQKGMKQAQSQMNNFRSNVSRTVKAIGATLATLGAGMYIKNGVEDAMKFEALMGTLSESLGKSMNDFVKWQKTVGASLGYSKLQSAELANMLSLNFKQFATSQKDLLEKTTKMMETAAVISSKRGMAMTEVSDRIRSAMNQEADGADELGVNVRVTAMQQSKAYKEMANGVPWAQLSTNMQKAILYHHILEQVSTNLGDTLQNNTAMKMSAFTASLADARMALGEAFLPVLNVVLPVLTAFMRKIEAAFQYVSAFTRALFGVSASNGLKQQTKATQQQTSAVSGLGNATEKTGKKAKKAGKDAKGSLAAFDELNKLAEKAGAASDSGGGAGGGGVTDAGIGFDSSPSEGAFDKISKKVQELAEKVKKFFAPAVEIFKHAWGAVSDFFTEKVKGMTEFWNENGSMIVQGFKNIWNFIKPIIMIIVDFVWESIKGLIDGVIKVFQGLLKFIGGVFTGDWSKAWEGLKDIFFGAIQAIWNFFNLTFVGGIKKALLEIVENGAKAFLKFADDFKKPIQNALTNIVNFFKSSWSNIRLMIDDFGLFWDRLVFNLALKWYEFSTKVTNSGKAAWEGIKSVFSGAVEWFARSIITPIVNRFGDIKDAFSGSITNGFKKIYNTAAGWLNDMIGNINKIKIPGVWDGVKIPKIPMLAQGGYVGANSPVLAMIGDNRNEGEIVAPESKLYEQTYNAIKDALSQTAGSGGHTEIVINLGGTTVFRKLIDGINQAQRQAGKTLIEV